MCICTILRTDGQTTRNNKRRILQIKALKIDKGFSVFQQCYAPHPLSVTYQNNGTKNAVSIERIYYIYIFNFASWLASSSKMTHKNTNNLKLVKLLFSHKIYLRIVVIKNHSFCWLHLWSIFEQKKKHNEIIWNSIR